MLLEIRDRSVTVAAHKLHVPPHYPLVSPAEEHASSSFPPIPPLDSSMVVISGGPSGSTLVLYKGGLLADGNLSRNGDGVST